jgi:hypothetical protein
MELVIAMMIAMTALIIILTVFDHRRHKLEGYKRMMFCPGIIKLSERYLKLEAPRRMLPQVGRLTDSNCFYNDLSWPWAGRLSFTTREGKMIIDFPLQDDTYRRNEALLLRPVVMFKKGKLGLIERQKIIKKLTSTIRLHAR